MGRREVGREPGPCLMRPFGGFIADRESGSNRRLSAIYDESLCGFIKLPCRFARVRACVVDLCKISLLTYLSAREGSHRRDRKYKRNTGGRYLSKSF